MVEMVTRGRTNDSIYRYAKAINKYIKYYDPDKMLSYLMYQDVHNLYGRNMSQQLSVISFEWTKTRLSKCV